MNNKKKILEIKNISKVHNNIEILKSISFVAYEHEVISIIGPSGTGKSTLLRCINLLNNPNTGEIILNGKNIILEKKNNLLKAKFNKELIYLRQKVGFVFQNFNLWQHRTIIENITEAPIYTLKKHRSEAIEYGEFLLNKVGLLNKKTQYPHELSGGEQQRVAIARALAVNPSVILLDEPTSALDPEKTKEVTDVLANLAKEGMTMIIVSHEMNFCKNISNRIMFLNNGTIEEEGSPTEIFEFPRSMRLKQFLNMC